jgi:hypothetical protein
MAAPLLDLSLQYIVQHTLKTIRANPEERVREIFGDARVEPLAALYGDDYLNQIRDFFKKRDVPVVLGFNIAAAQIPGVSIHLERSAPAQQFLGDKGLVKVRELQARERPVNVKKFGPVNVEADPEGRYLIITPPDGEEYDKILPGLHWRDKKGQEYAIGMFGVLPTMIPLEGGAALSQADTNELEVISPFRDQRMREGVMRYSEVGMVTVHGHSDRSEGLWVWAAVQHGLLKYRELLDRVFGIQLGVPNSSDFAKADEFLGDNVWRRFITVETSAVWSWDSAPMLDIAAFLETCRHGIRAQQVSQELGRRPTVLIDNGVVTPPAA